MIKIQDDIFKMSQKLSSI